MDGFSRSTHPQADTSVELTKGWNMISSPFESSQISIENIRSQCELEEYNGEYSWYLRNGAWEHPSLIGPHEGAYVKAKNSCEVYLTGNQGADLANIEISPEKWTMISFPKTKHLNEVGCDFKKFYGYTAWNYKNGWNKLDQDEELQPEKSYLVKTSSNCMIKSLKDADGDGLSDERERQIGTDIEDSDTDGDGLKDKWEVEGYDHDKDGEIEVPIDDYGADPLRKDVFVEIDYKSDAYYPFNFTYDTTREEILEETVTVNDGEVITIGDIKDREEIHRSVEEAFSEAPVQNPDGSQGINLHVDQGQLGGGEHLEDWSRREAVEIIQSREENMKDARKPIFYYVLVDTNGSSWGSSGGKYIELNDGSKDEDFSGLTPRSVWVATFMHELGHSLGIENKEVDKQEYLPTTYPSIMNYYASSDMYLDFSNQPPFNDWKQIEDNKLTPITTSQ